MQHRIVKWALPASLVGITLLAYAPSLTYPFQFDDLANIVKYFDIRHKSLSSLFFSGSRWVSYWLNTLYYALSRFDPFWYRVGSVLSHTATGMLVYALICRLGALRRDLSWQVVHAMATSATLLFLVHPVQTQTVSYVIQGQLEGLATLSMLLMAHLFITAATSLHQKSRAAAFLAMVALVPIICGTKEIVIITPALLILIDWFFVARGSYGSIKQRWWIHLPVGFLIGSAYFYFLKPSFFLKVFGFASETRNNVGNILTEDPSTLITPYLYLISQFKVIVHYIWIFIWPWSISIDYDWKLSTGFFTPDVILPLALLGVIAAWLIARYRKDHGDWIVFGFLWFFICILPRASIVPSTELIADYKTYAASIGLFIACGYALSRAMCELSPQLIIVVYIAMASFLGAATYARNTVWRSGEEFWENVIANAPRKARAYNNYGVALSEKHKFKEAIEQFKKGIMLDRFYPDPWVNIAVSYGALKELDKAIAAIKQAIAMQPYYPENYNNLASFLMQKQEYEEAEKMLLRAIELRPYYGKAYFNMGRLYLERNRPEEAFTAFKTACEKADFDNEIGFSTLGTVSALLQRYDEAAKAYARAVALNPHSVDYRFALANSYFLGKNYESARTYYEQLARAMPGDVRFAYNLAESYRMLNKLDQALVWYKKAQQLGSTMPQLTSRIDQCVRVLQNQAPTPSE